MHRKTMLVLLLMVLLSSLYCTPLPPFDVLAEHAQTPMLLLEAEKQTILYANEASSQLFSIPQQRIPGRAFYSLLSLPKLDLPSLSEKTVNYKDAEGKIHQLHVRVQTLVFEGSTYLAVMLEDLTDQAQLVIRNRILTITLMTLLFIIVLFLVLFILLQVKHVDQLEQHQKQQGYTIGLLKGFLDADRRFSCVRDEQHRLVVANTSLLQFLDRESEDILKETFSEIADPYLAAMLEQGDSLVLDGLQRVEYEAIYESHIYAFTKFPLILPDGSPGIGTFAADVTNRKDQERILKQNLQRNALLVELFSSTFTTTKDHLHTALQKACELTHSAEAFLLLKDDESNQYTLESTYGNLFSQPQKYSIDATELESFPQLIPILKQKGAYISTTEEENSLLTLLYADATDDVENTMIVPFWVSDTLLGIVVLANNPQGYHETDSHQIQLLFAAVNTVLLKAQKEAELASSREHLRLILDSTAEGIFGTDLHGLCTFCNTSCLSLLGYENEQQLLGKNMHQLIHHTNAEGQLIDEKSCIIRKSIQDGEGIYVESEIFWRKDGSSFDVLCHSYPQIKEGIVVGSVITFSNNTERKANLAKIQYLSYHDQLTGLYNRAYFDDALLSLDTSKNLPLSIIVGDVNGLKLTNDIFGHSAGDSLLCVIAAILTRRCREDDVICRIGGDEYVIILPNTSEETAQSIISAIQSDLSSEQVLAGARSIALGSATKTEADVTLHAIFEVAEDHMYQMKTLSRNETQQQQLQVLLSMLFKKAPKEADHAHKVQSHAAMIAKQLRLDDELRSLASRAGYFHDIGKVVLSSDLINAKERGELLQKDYQMHVSSGYRILNTFDETVDLAPFILHHHEWWNGKGYLKGLKGNEIPFISRILRLAEVWEREKLEEKKISERIEILRNLSGFELDPYLVEQIISSF